MEDDHEFSIARRDTRWQAWATSMLGVILIALGVHGKPTGRSAFTEPWQTVTVGLLFLLYGVISFRNSRAK